MLIGFMLLFSLINIAENIFHDIINSFVWQILHFVIKYQKLYLLYNN